MGKRGAIQIMTGRKREELPWARAEEFLNQTDVSKGLSMEGLSSFLFLPGCRFLAKKFCEIPQMMGAGRFLYCFYLFLLDQKWLWLFFFSDRNQNLFQVSPKRTPPKIQCNLSGLIQSVLGSWSTSNLSSSIFFPEEIMQYFIAYFHIPNCHPSIKISERSCKWNANLHKLKWKTSTNVVAAWHMHSLGETYVVNFRTVGR